MNVKLVLEPEHSTVAENLTAGPDRTLNLTCPNRNFEDMKTDGSYI